MNAETMNPMDNLIRKMNLSTLSIPSVHITDIIDIIIVAIVIYTVIHWIKETRAWSLFRGLMVIAMFSLLSYNLHFYTITWIIERTFSVGVIAVIIIFQPELRKALEQIGAGGFCRPNRLTTGFLLKMPTKLQRPVLKWQKLKPVH